MALWAWPDLAGPYGHGQISKQHRAELAGTDVALVFGMCPHVTGARSASHRRHRLRITRVPFGQVLVLFKAHTHDPAAVPTNETFAQSVAKQRGARGVLTAAFMRASFLISLTLLALLLPRSAMAADPPVSATPIVVEPEKGQAAAAPPSPTTVPITATCMLGAHPGIQDDEARTAADIICHELAVLRATNTQHEVRFGHLGGRRMVVLASRNGNAYDERRTFVTGLDEINVAAPRLASALATGKPLEETRDVDNVLNAEGRTSKAAQRGALAFDGALFGVTNINAPNGASAGIDLGLAYRAGNIGLNVHGRGGGVGSGLERLALASLDVGGRYYFSSGDFAPFVGVGLGASYLYLKHDRGGDQSGSGATGYGQAGVEMLRTHHVAFTASVRVDTPVYALAARGERDAQYVLPLSLNAGLVFH